MYWRYRDEIFVSNLRVFNKMQFQDVAKKGLQYGDEDVKQEKKDMDKFKEDYKPLVDFFVESTKEAIKDGRSHHPFIYRFRLNNH
jgi:heat shock protein 90kDa beta